MIWWLPFEEINLTFFFSLSFILARFLLSDSYSNNYQLKNFSFLFTYDVLWKENFFSNTIINTQTHRVHRSNARNSILSYVENNIYIQTTFLFFEDQMENINQSNKQTNKHIIIELNHQFGNEKKTRKKMNNSSHQVNQKKKSTTIHSHPSITSIMIYEIHHKPTRCIRVFVCVYIECL